MTPAVFHFHTAFFVRCLPSVLLCLSVCLSVCLPACLLSVCLSVLPACLPACLSVCLPACLPVCVCLSVVFKFLRSAVFQSNRFSAFSLGRGKAQYGHSKNSPGEWRMMNEDETFINVPLNNNSSSSCLDETTVQSCLERTLSLAFFFIEA